MAEISGCFYNDIPDADKVVTIKCLEKLFENILQAVGAVIGVALFIMLIIGGYSLLFSGGDPKKLQQARGTITMAIIGLVIIASAYLILKVLESFLGVSLSTFTVQF